MSTPLDRLTTALADRYVIERELGEGGMATVYLAEDIKHHRKVAIKLLKPELAAVLGADRFVQEITTTAALQHPHILPLFDSGEADGFLWYAMPFVDGETLRDKLNRETQLGVDEAMRIATEIADALHYAHTQGVVDRDIKPENILLANGRPMVADFGIALAVSAAAGGRMTETGLSLGTPHYMSPEQATAEKEITARSDVYSLGSMLYEMLSGEPPHTGGSAQQIIMKIIAEEAQPLTSLRKSVPQNVAAAVAKSLEKLPADRFESAAAFAAALADRGFTTAGIAGTASGTTGSINWIRDRRTVGLGLLAVALLAWGATRQGGSTGPTAYDVGLPDSAGMFALQSIGFDMDRLGRFVVYQTANDGASELWYRSLDDAETRRLEGTDGGVLPTVAPDGSEVAFIRLKEERWTLETIGIGGGTPVVLANGADEIGGLDWLVDGRIQLLESDNKQARWIDPGGGATTTLPIKYCINAAELSDPDAMLCGGGGGKYGYLTDINNDTTEAWLWRRDGVDSIRVFGSHFRLVGGKYLTYISAGGDLLAAPVNLESRTVGNAVRMVTGLGRRNYTGAGTYDISETGTLLYAQGTNAAVGHLVLAGDAGLDTLPVGVAPFLRFALSPDGETLAAVVEALEGEELRVYDLANGRHTVWATDAEIRQPVWSPDGDRLMVVTEDTILIGSPTRGVAPVAVAPNFGGYEAYSWLSGDRVVGVLWEQFVAAAVNIGERPVTVDSLATDASFVRVSPNERWMAYSDGAINNIWLQPLPADGTRFQVVANAGEPLWISDSRLAFWLFDDRGITVDVVDLLPTGSAPFGGRRRWLALPGFRDTAGQSFNLSPDGRILYVQGRDEEPTRYLRVIPNWVEQMKRAVDEANR